MKKLLVALFLLVFVLPAPAGEDTLDIYDVGDLVTRGHSIKSLLRRIGEAVPEARVNPSRESRLVVMATPEAQEKIAALLSELRSRAQPLVTLETRFLRGGAEDVVPPSPVLDAAALEGFLRMIAKEGKINVLSAPRLSCFNGQRANVTLGSERTCVRDLRVEFERDDRLVVHPVMDKIFEGVEASFRPILSLDGKHVTLVIDAKIRKLLEPEPGTSETKTSPVSIDLLEVRELRRLTSVTIPVGHAALLDLGTIPVDGREQPVRLLVSPTVAVMEDD
ncbi:MAG: hypothetical protein ABFS86_02390 [Planctomycetota bacterium]